MKIDFHKEIRIIPSFYKVILPSIISYMIVIIAYFGGEDGLFFLVSWMIDPFVFLYIPLLQRHWCKQKNNCQKIHLLIYFLIQIVFEIHPSEPNVGNDLPHIKWKDWSNGKSAGADGHIYFKE